MFYTSAERYKHLIIIKFTKKVFSCKVFSFLVHEIEVTRARSCLSQRLDHLHQLVTGSDVHSAVFIGQTSAGDSFFLNPSLL